ncbi:MAG: protein kinase, partial [bacterium]
MIGKTISHYKILEKLGEGGMGVVYKAEDTKLERFVALKFLPAHLSQDAENKKRFIHEAKAASALDHPNICTIYEIDETEDGQTFIVMACYEGETLQKKVARGQLSVDSVIDIAVQTAQGLAKAHAQGIVHRDIKPANIIVTNDGVVKIVDFGLAKLRGRTVLTKEGTTLGTVSYMSPEQTQGAEVDRRTDIWALGAVIYEMVTGQQPFRGEYEQAVMYSIMNEDVAPLTALRTGIPMELERIVNKALAKSPDDRYQHLDELCVDLKSISKGLESGRMKPKPTRPGPARKERSYLYGGIAVLILLLIAGGIYLRQRVSQKGAVPVEATETVSASRWQNSIAVLPFANISADPEQEYFSDGMTEQIITNLSQLQALKVIARTSVMKFKNTEKTIPEIGNELKVAYVLEGSVRKFGNRIRVTAQLINTKDGFHLWANDYDRELKDVFAVQDYVSVAITSALLEKLSAKESEKIKTKTSSNSEAYNYFLKGSYFHQRFTHGGFKLKDYHTAEVMLKKAIEHDPNYARSYAELANLYNTYYGYKAQTKEEKGEYLDLQEKFINMALRLDPASAEILNIAALVYWVNDQLDKRLESIRKALYINPNLVEASLNMGFLLRNHGLL